MMEQRRSILVTGASSGIGRATALLLADHNWRVFATVRKEADGARLAAETKGDLKPIILDVSDEGAIGKSAQLVGEILGDRGLDALFNNAGIGMTAPVEFTSSAALRNVFDINLFGQISVIQAFLPLIRAARGRIINAGSIGDHLTPPFAGAMCASKTAFASMTAALRLELRSQGIHVILIEPGSINTPAVDKTLGEIDETLARMGDDAEQLYGNEMRRVAQTFAANERAGSKPEAVAAVVERALNASNPKTRYLAGKDASKLAWLAWALPEKLLDRVVLGVFGLTAKFGSRSDPIK